MKCPSAQDATRRATAKANSLEGPGTKVSKLKRSCRPCWRAPDRLGRASAGSGAGRRVGASGVVRYAAGACAAGAEAAGAGAAEAWPSNSIFDFRARLRPMGSFWAQSSPIRRQA